MSKSGNQWTDSEHRDLVRMVADGMSASEIARSLNKSRNAVLGRAHREGIVMPGSSPARTAARRPWTAAEDAELQRMADAGHSGPEIARALQRPAGSVVKRAAALHCKLTDRRGWNTIAKRDPARQIAVRPARTPRPDTVVLDQPPLHLLIEDMSAQQCRYAVNDASPYRFCGHPVEPGTAWCPGHRSIVYQPGTARIANRPPR